MIVDESAEITQTDRWFDFYNNRIGSGFWILANKAPSCNKIIATINHSISLDVAMVIVEDAVEKLAKEEFKIPEHEIGNVYFGANTAFLRVGFKKGHNAAQQKGVYSEKQVQVLMNEVRKDYDSGIVDMRNNNEIIQSLKQENIELDMEYLSNDGIWKCVLLPSEWEVDTKNRIKTDRVAGQLMAYLKTKS